MRLTVRYTAKLVTILFTTGCFFPAAAIADSCDRLTSVVGWLHPDWGDADVVSQKINEAALLSVKKDCSNAEAILANNLKAFDRKLNRARYVITRLNDIYATSKFNVIGVEQNEKDELRLLASYIQWEAQFESMRVACPTPAMTNLIKETSILYFGPEYTFAKANEGRVFILGVDSAELGHKTAEVLSQLHNIKLDDKQLSPASQRMIYQSKAKVDDGEVLDIDLLKKLIANERSPAVLSKLKFGLSLLEERDRLVVQRNAEIVEHLLARAGKYVVVIGKFHVENLNKQFADRCSEASSNEVQRHGVVQ